MRGPPEAGPLNIRAGNATRTRTLTKKTVIGASYQERVGGCSDGKAEGWQAVSALAQLWRQRSVSGVLWAWQRATWALNTWGLRATLWHFALPVVCWRCSSGGANFRALSSFLIYHLE
jgi:hypothetical protein